MKETNEDKYLEDIGIVKIVTIWPGLILFEKKSHNGQIHKMPNINVANNKNIELSNKATKYLLFI